MPQLESHGESRAREEELKKIARTHGCRSCGKPVQVGFMYDQAKHRLEYLLRCMCYPEPPQLYYIPSMMEAYRLGMAQPIYIANIAERLVQKQIDRARERMAEMNTSEMVLFKTPDGGEVGLDVQSIKDIFCAKATDAEATLFLRVCQFQGMNPFLRDAYLIKYDPTMPASIVIGKGFYEQRAAEDPQFAGLRAGIVVEQSGTYVEIEGMLIPKGASLVGGWAEVHRLDRRFPTKIVVALSEYSKRQATWTQMPNTMIRKVALVQALREAFPNRFHPIPGVEAGQVIDEEELPYIAPGVDQVVTPWREALMDVEGHTIVEDTGEITEPPEDEGGPPEEQGSTLHRGRFETHPYAEWAAMCPNHSELWAPDPRGGKYHRLTHEQEEIAGQKGCYFTTVTSAESERLAGGNKERNIWLGQHRGGRLWNKLREDEQVLALVDLRVAMAAREEANAIQGS